MKSRKYLSKSFYGIGIVAFIAMIALIFMGTEPNIEYGGDAYTGIQNAAAQTANNIKTIGYYLFFIIGLTFVCLGKYHSIKADEELLEQNKKSDKTSIDYTNDKSNISDDHNIVSSFHNVCNTSQLNNNSPNISKTPHLDTVIKICPFCGDAVTSNKCGMCGKMNNFIFNSTSTNSITKDKNEVLVMKPNKYSKSSSKNHSNPKRCPHCGELVYSNTCIMCGMKNREFPE